MLRSFSSTNKFKLSRFVLDHKPLSISSSKLSLKDDWEKLAKTQLKETPIESLTWHTAEVSQLLCAS